MRDGQAPKTFSFGRNGWSACVPLVLSLTGCMYGSVLPAIESTPELVDSSPLKGAAENIRTLAVLPSSIGKTFSEAAMRGEFLNPLSEKAVTHDIGEGFILKITEQLQLQKRFQILTPYQVETTLQTPTNQVQQIRTAQTLSMTASEKEDYRQKSISEATSQLREKLKADGVILIEAERENAVGGVTTGLFGRTGTTYRLTMSVLSVETGSVLWRQTVVKSINAGMGATPYMMTRTVDPEVISAMVENFNQTFR